MPFLNRSCVKKYQISGTEAIIEEGVDILISTLGLHMDEKYYEDPQRYNPDRFSNKKMSEISQPYYPFGDGPRNCIGLRLGILQIKIALVSMLQKFKYDIHNQSKELKLDPKHFLMVPLEGICLKLSQRTK